MYRSLKYIFSQRAASRSVSRRDRTYRHNFYGRFERNWSKLRACLPSVLRRAIYVCTYTCTAVKILRYPNGQPIHVPVGSRTITPHIISANRIFDKQRGKKNNYRFFVIFLIKCVMRAYKMTCRIFPAHLVYSSRDRNWKFRRKYTDDG